MSKVQSTRDYSKFTRSNNNRATDVRGRKALMKSMKMYGSLKCFPIVVKPVNGKLEIVEGQHRFAMCESLGLPVHYINADCDFDIALVNSCSEKWTLKNYAQTWANLGHEHYTTGLEFAGQHRLPLGIAFALLAGNTSFGNIKKEFVDGNFKVKDRDWADKVAGIFSPLVALNPSIKNACFIAACMAVCRVEEFDVKRLVQSAEKHREKLVPYSTREANLDMLEQIYNHGRTRLFGLKIAATMAMRERNPQINKDRMEKARSKSPNNRKKTVVAGH